MSRTIAGVMNWGQWGAALSTEELSALITSLVENGITSIDHADIYGGFTTEKEWGAGWKHAGIPRDKVQIISKCGICFPTEERPNYYNKHYNYSYDHIVTSAKRSVENLQCDYLDLLLLHRPSPLMNPEEISRAFHFLQEEGLVRKLGVSNFTVSQMDLLRKHVPISANQIELSLTHIDPFHDGVVDYCYQHGIEVQAWSPLSGGKLFAESSDYEWVSTRARVKGVADKYGWGLDTLSYVFLLHHPAGIKPVVGSSKIERVLTCKRAEEIKITDAQWFEIWEASQGQEVP